LQAAATSGDAVFVMRCECGDPRCRACVALTRVEYEAVRSYGSHFAIDLDHENPENACVLHENARFSVIDVIARVERHEALARNPRHAWVAADANDRLSPPV
jgi:carbamoylphosphate synthase large subunit